METKKQQLERYHNALQRVWDLFGTSKEDINAVYRFVDSGMLACLGEGLLLSCVPPENPSEVEPELLQKVKNGFDIVIFLSEKQRVQYLGMIPECMIDFWVREKAADGYGVHLVSAMMAGPKKYEILKKAIFELEESAPLLYHVQIIPSPVRDTQI